MIETFFLLLVGHAVADFALQTEIMARLKNRHNKPDNIPNGQKYIPCWIYWMSSHSLIHAGAVYVVTGSLVWAIFEFCSHFIIDMLKCENVTNPNQDQISHVWMKVVYALAVNLK